MLSSTLTAPGYEKVRRPRADGGASAHEIAAQCEALDQYFIKVSASEADLDPEWRTGFDIDTHEQTLGRNRAHAEALYGLQVDEIVPGVSVLNVDATDAEKLLAFGMTAEQVTETLEREAKYFAEIATKAAKAAGDPLYIDVAALLSGDFTAPRPTLGVRSDGEPFIYEGAVNVIFGPPESGKTLALSALAADTLFDGGSVLWIDIDHNGAPATIARFISFGISTDVLTNSARFRLALPEDKESVLNVVKDASRWKPTLVALDSIGELLPMFGANSNSDDDYTAVHRAVLSKMAIAGSAVVGVDHEAKGQASRDFGAGGAVAKKRAIDGILLRASIVTPFTPGRGGKATLKIVKDRHGGVRAISPADGEREPIAATFELTNRHEATNWSFSAPSGAMKSAPNGSDLDILKAMHPAPKSIYDIKARLKWGSDRASKAFALFSERNSSERSGTF